MDSKRFDRLARGIGQLHNRRSLLKGVIGGIAAVAAGTAIDEAQAATSATLTIHNATCGRKLTGQAIYDACHANGFGCVNFSFRNRSIRTNRRGVASTTIAPGSVTLRQQTLVVNASNGIWVHCTDTISNRNVFSGRADSGSATFTIKSGEKVVCDWYNYSGQTLAVPGQCPSPTTTAAPTTTPAPTTTTTTTTPNPCVPPGANTLQAAIDAADPESTVCLQEGTFTATTGDYVAVISKHLTITGQGPDKTTIDARSMMGGLHVTDHSIISNLAVINFGSALITRPGLRHDSTGIIQNVVFLDGKSSAIVMSNNILETQLILQNVAVVHTSNAGGKIINIANANVLMDSCLVYENATTGDGTIYVGGSSTLYLTESTSIMLNSARKGAGVLVGSTDAGIVSAAAISGNTASDKGGGVYVAAGYYAQVGGAISTNSALQGGAAAVGLSGYFINQAGTLAANNATTDTNPCDNGAWMIKTSTCCPAQAAPMACVYS